MQSFQEGDRVRSLVQSDDLRVDEVYTVVQVNRQVAPGQRVEFEVLDDDGDVVTAPADFFELVEDEGGRDETTVHPRDYSIPVSLPQPAALPEVGVA